MKHKYHSSMKPLIIAVVLVVFATAGQLLGARVSQSGGLPAGDWTFSAGPYFGAEYELLPVDVVSVYTDATKGLTVYRIGVLNKTAKPVRSMKFTWQLADESSRTKVLLEGTTPLIARSNGVLLSAHKDFITYPIVSFSEIAKQLVRGGRLHGHYRVSVFVNEVEFDDGSTWKKSKDSVAPATFLLTSLTTSPIRQEFGCAKQKCNWSIANHSYECTTSTDNEFCTVESDKKCGVTRCDEEVVGSIPRMASPGNWIARR